RTSEPIDHAGYPADDCEASAPGVPRYRPAPTKKGPHAYHVTFDPAGKRVLDRLGTSSGKLVHLHAGHGAMVERQVLSTLPDNVEPSGFPRPELGFSHRDASCTSQPGPRFDRCYA